MNLLALRMLLGDRAKYLGIVVGLTFACLLITQQAAIFLGFVDRTGSFIDDTRVADLWVMDNAVEHHSDSKRVNENVLHRVRSTAGVEWAAPMYRGFAQMRLPDGRLRNCILIGIDDETLIGGPPEMVEGRLEDLRRSQAVFVDHADLGKKLAIDPRGIGERVAIRVGDVLELNDHRAVIVGTFRVQPGFFWEPVVYTTYSRTKEFVPGDRRRLTFVLVKATGPEMIPRLQEKLRETTGLMVLTNDEFKALTRRFIIDKTGIAVNFGIAIALGFVVGTAVAGQTFYVFTMDNLKHFAALKAMGVGSLKLIGMVLTQSLAVGFLGFGIGVGLTSIFGMVMPEALAFKMPWQLVVFSAGAIGLVCILSAAVAIRPVLRLEPAVVFKN